MEVRTFTTTMSKVYHIAPESAMKNHKDTDPLPILCDLRESAVRNLRHATRADCDKRKLCSACMEVLHRIEHPRPAPGSTPRRGR